MGQIDCIYKYVDESVDLFVIGGPADEHEAQDFHKQFPHIKVVGFEPCKSSYYYQLQNGFPGPLFYYALWETEGEKEFYTGGEEYIKASRMFSMPATTLGKIKTTTLDKVLGKVSFNKAILWLDIERSEYYALLGARNLFAQNKIKAALIEIVDDPDQINENKILSFFAEYNFVEVDRIDADRIFHVSETE